MTKNWVFVTGATGNIGMATLKSLMSEGSQRHRNVQAGVPSEVKAAIKKGDDSQVKAEIEKLGVHTVELDYNNEDSLAKALDNVHKLFIVPDASDSKLEHTRNIINAAKKANIPFVLLLSVVNAEHRKDLFAKEFLKFEKELIASGLHCSFLRVDFFDEDFLLFKSQIMKEKELRMCLGNGKFAPIAHTDVGKAAAKILDTQEGGGATHTYNLTGPEVLDGNTVAEKMCKFLNTEVTYKDVSEEEMKKYLLEKNKLSEHEAEGITEMCRVIKQGNLNISLATFKELTATEAKFLEGFLIENKEKFMTRE